MSKKNRNKNRALTAPHDDASRKAPRVLFIVGDADLGYTEGKILRLAQRVKTDGFNVRVLTHDEETLKNAKDLMLDARRLTIESPGVTVAERLRCTDEMIRETADLTIPGSDLLLWKVLAMDDFLSSLQLFGALPACSLDEAEAIVVPIICVDNNTRNTCGLYVWAVSEARRKGIPVIGLEVSPLGNKNTLSHLPADHYAVKGRWSQKVLTREGLAEPSQVSILPWEESYCLWAGRDDYTEAYLQHEAKARELLNLPTDAFTVLIPHHVAFLWEARQILAALAKTQLPLHVVIRVEASTSRRQFPEREIVLQSYGKEINALPHVVIDERVGIGLLLQLADLIVAPFAGTATERAILCHKPTIICQALGQEGWQADSLYWEPQPEKIPALICEWMKEGRLTRRRLAQVIQAAIDRVARAAA